MNMFFTVYCSIGLIALICLFDIINTVLDQTDKTEGRPNDSVIVLFYIAFILLWPIFILSLFEDIIDNYTSK